MGIVGLEESVLNGLCAKAAKADGPNGVCKIANHLFPKGFSCAGTEKAVQELEKLAMALDEALPSMKPPRCNVYFNVDAKPLPAGSDPKQFLELMKKQLTSPVLWTPSVSAMMKDGVKQYYECGPMKQIKAMMKRIDQGAWKETTN